MHTQQRDMFNILSVQVLKKAISLTDQEAEPKNEEASRVLKFFMSTLLNGSMKAPQPLDHMRSLTTVRFLSMQYATLGNVSVWYCVHCMC